MAASYYKYKKESLTEEFNTANDTIALMQGAMDEYETNNSIYLKRAIIGYYQDFAEYIIDVCETYLVMSDTYVDGCSSLEIIKRSSIHGFINENLSRFLVGVVRLRNRYTHDYYKREVVEEDIFRYCFSQMRLLKIFLEITNSKIRLDFLEKDKK